MAQQMNDILLSSGSDILISGGDFVLGESTAEHQQQLLLNNMGDYKENPTICVGAFQYLNDENYQGLTRAVSVAFSRDGMEVSEIELTRDGQIKTNAEYP